MKKTILEWFLIIGLCIGVVGLVATCAYELRENL